MSHVLVTIHQYLGGFLAAFLVATCGVPAYARMSARSMAEHTDLRSRRREFLGRLLILLGAHLWGYLAIWVLHLEVTFMGFVGGFLAVTSYQVAFWAAGLSTELLGNVIANDKTRAEESRASESGA